MSKDKLIPELRFPEFKNDEEWKESVLGSVAEIKGRIGYRGYTIEDIVDKGKGAITLSPSNFHENGQLNFEKCTYISWDKYEESPEIQLKEGQTVLVKTASVGKTAYVDKLPEKATVNPQIVVLKPRAIHDRFLAFTISHQNTQNQIRNNVGAGAIPNISQEIISKLKILLPPDEQKKEQQKIASCLSSLDEVIAAHSQKLELLKDYKKGLMQNLFPQEGEKVPKYRFNGFDEDGVWAETRLDRHLEITSGYAFKSEFFSERGRKLVTPKNFTKEGRANFRKEYTKYTIEDFNPKYLCKPGDLLLLLTDLTPSCELLGKPILLRNEDGEVLLNQRIIKLEVTTNLEKEFLFQFFLTSDFHRRVKSTASGTTVRHSSNTIIHETTLLIPRNPYEQKMIASCLSNLDELIAAQSQKIEQLQNHKKGLLQRVFPKIKY